MSVKKNIAASVLIAIGVYGTLTIANPFISAFLFSLGLLTICYLNLNLFTGKCGYYISNFKELRFTLWNILIQNLVCGYWFGFLLSFAGPDASLTAAAKVLTWNFSFSYLLLSFMCGIIMYIAVHIYKTKGSVLGILMGVPMFILCGYQHCIANVIVMGIARTFSPVIFICILGNFIGSLFADYLLNQKEKVND